MKKFLSTLSVLAAVGAVAVPSAHADVVWEHTGKLTLGHKNPETILSLNSRQVWKGQRQRTSVFVDASALQSTGMTAGTPAEGVPPKAEAIIVQRLDDDRFITWSPQLKQYMDEPLRALPKRFRLNIWEKLDPALSAQDIPQLTPEQRARLGAEIRAATSPFIKKGIKTYFRELPNRRTINGLSCRGFRLTALINAGSGNNWMRMAGEWWLADEQEGDQEVRNFTQSLFKLKEEVGGPTASMWANETPYIILAALPEELHQAWRSMVGARNAPTYGFQGTPVQFFMTVSPPALERMATGDIRLTIELKSRSTTAVENTEFDPPTEYKRVELDPLLKMAENALRMGQEQLKQEFESEL